MYYVFFYALSTSILPSFSLASLICLSFPEFFLTSTFFDALVLCPGKIVSVLFHATLSSFFFVEQHRLIPAYHTICLFPRLLHALKRPWCLRL